MPKWRGTACSGDAGGSRGLDRTDHNIATRGTDWVAFLSGHRPGTPQRRGGDREAATHIAVTTTARARLI